MGLVFELFDVLDGGTFKLWRALLFGHKLFSISSWVLHAISENWFCFFHVLLQEETSIKKYLHRQLPARPHTWLGEERISPPFGVVLGCLLDSRSGKSRYHLHTFTLHLVHTLCLPKCSCKLTARSLRQNHHLSMLSLLGRIVCLSVPGWLSW